MLQLRSILKIADNTGGKTCYLIGIPGCGNKKKATIGDVVNIVIKEAIPEGMVKKGEKHQAVIVRTRKEKRRDDGSYIRFDDNACIILASKGSKDPKGTRVFGPIAKEIKDLGFSKIASLAEEMY